MSKRRKYIITVEEESHLKDLMRIKAGPALLISVIMAMILLLLLAGVAIASFSPLRQLLPGSLKEHQRQATIQEIMRIDSINEALTMQKTWMESFINATKPTGPSSDSTSAMLPPALFSADHLQQASPVEQRFVSAMEERERYHISVLAPLDADGMLFSSPAPDAIFTQASKGSKVATMLMASDSPVQSIADGTVVAAYLNRSATGYTIVVQHNRGFLSMLSHLGTPLVSLGDAVTAGQALALSPSYDAKGRKWVNVRIWHNGVQIVPYEILSSYI